MARRSSSLAEWHRLSVVTRLHVERLGEDDVRSLIANLRPAALPEREVQRIVARAEGNPFFAEELAARTSISARPSPVTARLTSLRIPWAFVRMVSAPR